VRQFTIPPSPYNIVGVSTLTMCMASCGECEGECRTLATVGRKRCSENYKGGCTKFYTFSTLTLDHTIFIISCAELRHTKTCAKYEAQKFLCSCQRTKAFGHFFCSQCVVIRVSTIEKCVLEGTKNSIPQKRGVL
jgi:hypothetical protein